MILPAQILDYRYYFTDLKNSRIVAEQHVCLTEEKITSIIRKVIIIIIPLK